MKKSEKESLDFQKQDPLLKQHSMEDVYKRQESRCTSTEGKTDRGR